MRGRAQRTCVEAATIAVLAAGLITVAAAPGAAGEPPAGSEYGSAPGPVTPLPPARPPDDPLHFGFNELRWATAWQAGDPASPDQAMHLAVDAAARAGADTSRLPVPWFDVVDAAGGWDEDGWSRYRDAYEAMLARGIRPVVILYATPRGVEQVDPNWAQPGCEGGAVAPPDPAYDPNWQAFVLRASNEFDQALGIQVWNEPNSTDYWGGPTCSPDPARYLELVALAREALSAPGSEHPDRLLVSAGLNPSSSPGSIPWDDYLAATVSGGLLERVQAVGVHPYPVRSDCERSTDLASALAAGTDTQLDQASTIVGPDVPIWVTEFGPSSAAGLTLDCRAVSEPDQARAVSAMYDSLAGRPQVDVAIVHQLVDEQADYPEQLPNRFGMTRDYPSFLAPKAAYWCLAERRGVAVDADVDCD